MFNVVRCCNAVVVWVHLSKSRNYFNPKEENQIMKNLLLCLLACIAIVTAWVADAAPLPLGVAIEFKGEPKDISDLIAKLISDPLNKIAKCVTVDDSTIACAKVGPKLKAFLKKNAPKTVTWEIVGPGDRPCPTGCVFKACPSTFACCYKTLPTHTCP
jgi:hypothetical protein